MLVNINNININYTMTGDGYPIVLIHGWGGSSKSFTPIHKHLESNFKTYSIDLPGFGYSDQPNYPWSTNDYADYIKEFFKIMGIENPIVIAHSFGGKIAIRLAADSFVKKLVLVNSAGIKSRRSLKYYIKVYCFKIAVFFLRAPIIKLFTAGLLERMRTRFGSEDYKNASVIMRQVLVKSVNEDLKHLLSEIKCPTLLVWGEQDTATPIKDAYIMNKIIPDSGIVCFKKAGHFSYLDCIDRFLIIINNFLKNEGLISNE